MSRGPMSGPRRSGAVPVSDRFFEEMFHGLCRRETSRPTPKMG